MTDQVKEQVLKYLEDATIGLDLFGEWKESQLKELTLRVNWGLAAI